MRPRPSAFHSYLALRAMYMKARAESRVHCDCETCKDDFEYFRNTTAIALVILTTALASGFFAGFMLH